MGNLCSLQRCTEERRERQYSINENNKQNANERRERKEKEKDLQPGLPQDLDIENLGDQIERLN